MRRTILCFCLPLLLAHNATTATPEELKREAKDLRGIGERAERKPPKPPAKDASKGAK